MKTVFITGASGFVGGYLRKELTDNGYKVMGSDLRAGNAEYIMDVTDKASVVKVIAEVQPDYIVHLAGFASVKASFANAELCYKINVEGTRNVFDAVAENNLKCRILAISSADTYAMSDKIIPENYPQEVKSPYGKSRLAQEALIKTYDNVDWVIPRSFPHVGPGQPLGFVTSDFASQIAAINRDPSLAHVIKVGNLEGIRDFTDVRDTVKAYRLLLEKGESHEIYNICSGEAIKIQEILDILLSLSKEKIEVVADPELVRPLDIVFNVGDNSKLVKQVSWERSYSTLQTLQDIYQYWLTTSA